MCYTATVMKWHDHIRITTKAAEDLGLDRSVIDKLRSAVIKPDQERQKYERHHSGKDSETMRRIWSARRAILRGKPNAAALELGWALHYIQDKSVPGGSRHNSIEREISSLEVPQNAIDNGRKRGMCSYHCARECVRRTTTKNDAQSAMWQATEHSTMLIKAVLCNARIPDALVKRMRQQKWAYGMVVAFLTGACLIGIPMSLITFAGWPRFPSVVLGLASVLSVRVPLRKYTDLRLESKWFASESKAQPTLF